MGESMVECPTTFVVGAGASCAHGLPSLQSSERLPSARAQSFRRSLSWDRRPLTLVFQRRHVQLGNMTDSVNRYRLTMWSVAATRHGFAFGEYEGSSAT